MFFIRPSLSRSRAAIHRRTEHVSRVNGLRRAAAAPQCSAVTHQIYITFVAPPAAVCSARRRVLCVSRFLARGRTRWSDINWRVIVVGLCNGDGLSRLRTVHTAPSLCRAWIGKLGGEGEILRRLQWKGNKYVTDAEHQNLRRYTSMYILLRGRPPNRIRAAVKRLPQFLYHSLRRNGKLRVA